MTSTLPLRLVHWRYGLGILSLAVVVSAAAVAGANRRPQQAVVMGSAGDSLRLRHVQPKATPDRGLRHEPIAAARAEPPQRLARWRQVLDMAERSPRALSPRYFLAACKHDNSALLELLAEDLTSLHPHARVALRTTLIEAIGSQRDGHAVRPLLALLERPDDPRVERALAVALGRLATDEAVARLLQLADEGDSRRRAALAGLGECRRADAAQALVRMLAERPPVEEARDLVNALRDAGNGWAWATPTLARTGAASAVRRTITAALLQAFVEYDDEPLRQQITKALLVVDLDTVQDQLGHLGTSCTALGCEALRELQKQLRHSPLRAPRSSSRLTTVRKSDRL